MTLTLLLYKKNINMKQETMLYYLDVNLEDVQQPYQRVHREIRSATTLFLLLSGDRGGETGREL